MHIQMETTNYCNLKCVECPNRFMKRERQHMSSGVFFKLLRDYISFYNPATMIMHKDGEPLLHPIIKPILWEISETVNSKIDIYTNGLLLREDHCTFLSSLKNPVSVLISFHFFNHDGRKIDYSKAEKEIQRCIANAGENINFVMVTHLTDLIINNPENQKEVDRWQSRWLDFSRQFPNLSAVHVNPYINPWGQLIKQSNAIHFSGCPYADGEHFFVGVTGNVIPCCMDLEEEIIFGNIMTDSRDSIMDKRVSFYDQIKKGPVEELCKRCLK